MAFPEDWSFWMAMDQAWDVDGCKEGRLYSLGIPNVQLFGLVWEREEEGGK
jgi:hypothetical protein